MAESLLVYGFAKLDSPQDVLKSRFMEVYSKELGDDIDAIIAQEQKERDDTDQMAVIMQLIHTKGHNE